MSIEKAKKKSALRAMTGGGGGDMAFGATHPEIFHIFCYILHFSDPCTSSCDKRGCHMLLD